MDSEWRQGGPAAGDPPPRASMPPPGWEQPPAAPEQPVYAAPPDPEPDGTVQARPLLWLVSVGVGLLVGIFVLSLRDSGPNGGPNPFSPVASAAQKAVASSGARFAGTGVVTAGGGRARVRFRGLLDPVNDRSSMRMEVESSVAPGISVQISPIDWVQDGDDAYYTAPLLRQEVLPGGNDWVAVHADGGDSATDVDAILRRLCASGEAREIGVELVRGVQATRYAGSVRLKGAGSSYVGAWIDEAGVLRRLTVTAPYSMPGVPDAQMKMQVDFFDFGTTPRIDVPSAGESIGERELVDQAGGAGAIS